MLQRVACHRVVLRLLFSAPPRLRVKRLPIRHDNGGGGSASTRPTTISNALPPPPPPLSPPPPPPPQTPPPSAPPGLRVQRLPIRHDNGGGSSVSTRTTAIASALAALAASLAEPSTAP